MKKRTRQQTKDHHMRLVLKTIYEQQDLSRADVARATGLTRPTVSKIVSELIDANFVVETGQGVSAGGKPPTLLDVAVDAHQLLCADLGSQVFRGAVVNLRGDIIEQVEFATGNRRQEEALQLTYTLIDALTEAATMPLLGLGVGTPGLIDPRRGIIKQAVNLGWFDLPLRELLEERYQVPIYVANDSHMAALAEYTFGAARDSNNLVVIKVSHGIGAGIVLNGQPYYGDGYGAGEIGHVVVAENGETCRCGNRGCLETVSSTRAILQHAQQMAPPQSPSTAESTDPPPIPAVTWEAIVAALQAGDTAVGELVTTSGKYLGVAVANLIGSLNIHHIVIAGRVTQFGDTLLAAIQAESKRRALPSMAAATQVTLSTLGSDIVILGSSAMILHHELGII